LGRRTGRRPEATEEKRIEEETSIYAPAKAG
jgi:hypothetical protein